MRSVIQRVEKASVLVNDKIISRIKNGLLVLVAIQKNDTEKNLMKMADKILHLRIFEDDEQKMNKSILETKGEILLVSQFTLYGDCKKGNRPSFIAAAPPDKAKKYYDDLVKIFQKKNIKLQTGQFQAQMKLELINDGPTTIILET
jgi:D-tyrosyl-tRNA(Tyr) deacylase